MIFCESKSDNLFAECPDRSFVSHWCCDPLFAFEGETPETSVSSYLFRLVSPLLSLMTDTQIQTAYDCEPWLGDFDITNFGL